jgi:hypothetical protein
MGVERRRRSSSRRRRRSRSRAAAAAAAAAAARGSKFSKHGPYRSNNTPPENFNALKSGNVL